jgi:acetyl-CoA carboxylase biotin carboxylase subunit
MPCPGQITFLHEPSGPRVRFDSGVTAGLSIEPYYDSMIAKIIVHGRTRGDAIKIMERALKEFRIDGVKTTVSLHKKILKDTYFRTGNIDTQFIKKRMDAYEAAPKDTKDMNEEELANTISESMYLA